MDNWLRGRTVLRNRSEGEDDAPESIEDDVDDDDGDLSGAYGAPARIQSSLRDYFNQSSTASTTGISSSASAATSRVSDVSVGATARPPQHTRVSAPWQAHAMRSATAAASPSLLYPPWSFCRALSTLRVLPVNLGAPTEVFARPRYSARITSLAFDRVGVLLAAAGADSQLRIWDLDSIAAAGQRVRNAMAPRSSVVLPGVPIVEPILSLPLRGSVEHMLWNPTRDNDVLVAVGGMTDVHYYDLSQTLASAPLFTLTREGDPYALDRGFSAGTTRLLFLDGSDPPPPPPVIALKPSASSGGGGGCRIVTGDGLGRVRLWDTREKVTPQWTVDLTSSVRNATAAAAASSTAHLHQMNNQASGGPLSSSAPPRHHVIDLAAGITTSSTSSSSSSSGSNTKRIASFSSLPNSLSFAQSSSKRSKASTEAAVDSMTGSSVRSVEQRAMAAFASLRDKQPTTRVVTVRSAEHSSSGSSSSSSSSGISAALRSSSGHQQHSMATTVSTGSVNMTSTSSLSSLTAAIGGDSGAGSSDGDSHDNTPETSLLLLNGPLAFLPASLTSQPQTPTENADADDASVAAADSLIFSADTLQLHSSLQPAGRGVRDTASPRDISTLDAYPIARIRELGGGHSAAPSSVRNSSGSSSSGRLSSTAGSGGVGVKSSSNSSSSGTLFSGGGSIPGGASSGSSAPNLTIRSLPSWGGIRALCPGVERGTGGCSTVIHGVSSDGAVVSWDLRKMFRPSMGQSRVPSPVSVWDVGQHLLLQQSTHLGVGVSSSILVQNAFPLPASPAQLAIVLADGRVVVADAYDGTLQCVTGPYERTGTTQRVGTSTVYTAHSQITQSVDVLLGAGCFLPHSGGVLCLPLRQTTTTLTQALPAADSSAYDVAGGSVAALQQQLQQQHRRNTHFRGGEGQPSSSSSMVTTKSSISQLAYVPMYRARDCTASSSSSAACDACTAMGDSRGDELRGCSSNGTLSMSIPPSRSSSSSASSFQGRYHPLRFAGNAAVTALAPHPSLSFSVATGQEDGTVSIVCPWRGGGEEYGC